MNAISVSGRDGVLEATALASRRLEASWRVLGLGLGLGSQVLGLGLGLEPKVLGLGPETVLALLVFKQILCKVLRLKNNRHHTNGPSPHCFLHMNAAATATALNVRQHAKFLYQPL